MSIEKHSRPGWYYVKYYPEGRKGPPKRRVAESYEEAIAMDNLLKQAKSSPADKATHPRLIDVIDSYLEWTKTKFAPSTC